MLPAVTDRLGRRQNLPLSEYAFLRAHAHDTGQDDDRRDDLRKRLWVPGYSDTVYPDRDEYMAEALRLMTGIVREVVEAGTTYVQLDSPRYTHMVSEEGRENLRKVGLTVATWLGDMIAMDNALIRPSPTSPSRSTCAVATTGACGRSRAATTRSPSSCSTTWRATGSSPSTTRRGPAPSSRCASSPPTRRSCSG